MQATDTRELMALRDICRKQAEAYVHNLKRDEMRSALRRHGVELITELIVEITRGLMQEDIKDCHA